MNISYNNHTLDSKFIYEISKTIYEESIKYNFNPLLITALIKVESNFEPKSYFGFLCLWIVPGKKIYSSRISRKILV